MVLLCTNSFSFDRIDRNQRAERDASHFVKEDINIFHSFLLLLRITGD